MLFTFLYLLSIVVWIGSVSFFSLIVAPTLFKSFPQDEAGKVVAALFPPYFRLGTIAGTLSLVCLILQSFRTLSFPAGRLTLIVLMLAATLFNSTHVYPKARGLREEIATTIDETLKPTLQEEFQRTHRTSVFLNGAVLVMGILLIYLQISAS